MPRPENKLFRMPPTQLSTFRNTLLERFSYDPQTGILTWKKTVGKANKGQPAGGVNLDGYIAVSVDNVLYLAHQLIFLMVNGKPTWAIDHINGNKSDNCFENLRPATISQNSMNRKIDQRNTSGCSGVHWHKNQKRWVAKIQINKKRVDIGYFKNKADAIAARVEAEKKHYGEYRHGN